MNKTIKTSYIVYGCVLLLTLVFLFFPSQSLITNAWGTRGLRDTRAQTRSPTGTLTHAARSVIGALETARVRSIYHALVLSTIAGLAALGAVLDPVPSQPAAPIRTSATHRPLAWRLIIPTSLSQAAA